MYCDQFHGCFRVHYQYFKSTFIGIYRDVTLGNTESSFDTSWMGIYTDWLLALFKIKRGFILHNNKTKMTIRMQGFRHDHLYYDWEFPALLCRAHGMEKAR